MSFLHLPTDRSEAQDDQGPPWDSRALDERARPEDADLEAEEEEEEVGESPLGGICVGIATAAVTFLLVFVIPYSLGWYEVGTPPSTPTRHASSQAVASAPAGNAPAPLSPPPASTPEEAKPPVGSPPAAPPKTSQPVGSPPAAPPKTTPAVSAGRKFWVQIAAFSKASQAGRLADRVKRDGYPADIRRLDSPIAPWVVWVGKYPSRERAEMVRDALARKGFPGFIR